MKKVTLTLFAAFMIAANIFAQEKITLNASQVSKLDVTGKWVGKRNQYSWDKKTFIELFQYEFDLKQEGNIVTGTSTIINSNGEYADMKLEGVLVGNKLHFREFEVKSAIRPEGKVWCFKSGELFFAKDGDNLKLVGSTASYMETYNYPCSGGETDIVKVDNSNNVVTLSNVGNNNTLNGKADKVTFNVYPNPFVDNSTVSYNLIEDSKVKVEIFDLTGKLVTNLFEGNQKAGSYNLTYSAKANTSDSGIYIVKMVVNGEVFSSQLVQMR